MNQIVDPYIEEREMSLLDFVNKLFGSAQDSRRAGLYVMRDDGHNTHIVLIPKEKEIEVMMDGVVMGRFEEYNGQGYKCAFYQKYRVGIKKGLTPNEALMKSFCAHPLVRFFDA